VPWRLGPLLTGRGTTSVQRQGGAGVKNGKLLALAASEIDALLTADCMSTVDAHHRGR
jgi:hypothetical protein